MPDLEVVVTGPPPSSGTRRGTSPPPTSSIATEGFGAPQGSQPSTSMLGKHWKEAPPDHGAVCDSQFRLSYNFFDSLILLLILFVVSSLGRLDPLSLAP